MADICKHGLVTNFCGHCNQQSNNSVSQFSNGAKEVSEDSQKRSLVSMQALAKLLAYKDSSFVQLKLAVSERKIPEPVKTDSVSMYFDKEQIDDFIQNVIGAEIKDEPFITTEEAAEILNVLPSQMTYLRKNEEIPYYELRLGKKRCKVLYRKSEILSAQSISLHWNGGFYVKNERIRAYEKIFHFLLQIPEVKEKVLTKREYFICESLFQESKSKKFLQGELNLSRERVRQLFEKIVRKIRDWLLDDFFKREEDLATREKLLAFRTKKMEEESSQLLEDTSRLKAEKNHLLSDVSYLENLAMKVRYMKSSEEMEPNISNNSSKELLPLIQEYNKLFDEFAMRRRLLEGKIFLEVENKKTESPKKILITETIPSEIEKRLQEIRTKRLNEDLTFLAHTSNLSIYAIKRLNSLKVKYPRLRDLLRLHRGDFRLIQGMKGKYGNEIEKWIEDMGFTFGMKDEN